MVVLRVLGRSVCRFVSTAAAASVEALRFSSTGAAVEMKKGVVLGVYEGGEPRLTAAAQKYNEATGGRLLELLKLSGHVPKVGKARLFFGLQSEFPTVAVAGLGKEEAGYNEQEEMDEKREAVRIGAAVGCKALRDVAINQIALDPCSDPEAVAEGAYLGLWVYQELKSKGKQKPDIQLSLYQEENSEQWRKGQIKAEGQNLARRLMETPANYMTPTIFAQNAVQKLQALNVQVEAHDKAWAENKKMGSFLSVTRGSAEPPVFLELTYEGAESGKRPIVLVGKGITFDSGGISIKPSARMDQMRGDMGGGACVVGTFYAAASLKLPVNLKGLIPLCENMPSGTATKPGDVVIAMNGKSIQVDNTDAEGRLVLADALCYAHEFQPEVIVDMATLTGAMRVSLGAGAVGVFSNSTSMWQKLHGVGSKTGDRMWRMPLWQHYTKQVTDAPLADVNNIGKHSPAGGACIAAAFLKEFVTARHWMHLDIAGVAENKDEIPYLCKGMTGRPVRTLVEFVASLA